MNKLLLRFFVKLHNYSYKYISRLVVSLNNGIHPKHRLMNYHQFFVDTVSPDDTVLDIGCGNGANTYDVAKRAKKVIGIDFEKKNIESARINYQRPNLEFIIGDATTYHFDQPLDKIILSNVLEHIKDRIEFLQKLHWLSKIILLRVPMITRDWLAVYKKEMGFEYRLDKTHFIEYTLEGLREELEQAGWTIKSHQIIFGEFWGVIESATQI